MESPSGVPENMKKSTPRPHVVLSNLGASADDIRHATRFAAPDPFFVVLPPDPRQSPVFLLSALEAARAAKACPRAAVHTPETLRRALPAKAELPADSAGRLAAMLGLLGIRRVALPPDFPFAAAETLRRARIAVESAPKPLFPGRAIKTPAEIRAIAASQRTAAAAFRAAAAAVARSTVDPRTRRLLLDGRVLTSERLRAIIETVFLERGCSAPEGTIAAAGRQAACPHETGHGPIRAGEAIVLDIFPRDTATGYWGDLTRTIVKGNPSPALRALHRTVAAAQRLAFSMIRPGVPRRAVHQAVVRFFRAAGYPERLEPADRACGFIHGLGHGIGLSIHESPGLRNDPGNLRAGEVLSVEPGLYYPAIGGVRIEDLVVVVPGGFRFLAACPRTFVVP
jgi:Xaa-Pro aminopeptidase